MSEDDLEGYPGFGKRLRKAMADANLRQVDLANILGTKQKTISQWATEKAIPDSRFLFRLPLALKCDANWLLTGRSQENVTGIRAVREMLDLVISGREDATVDFAEKLRAKLRELDIQALEALGPGEGTLPTSEEDDDPREGTGDGGT